jgi:hypothetical protein
MCVDCVLVSSRITQVDPDDEPVLSHPPAFRVRVGRVRRSCEALGEPGHACDDDDARDGFLLLVDTGRHGWLVLACVQRGLIDTLTLWRRGIWKWNQRLLFPSVVL